MSTPDTDSTGRDDANTSPNPPAPRVAIVTGGSGGIGRPTAERLAADGLAVIVHYSGHADRAAEVVAAIAEAGGEATAIQADVGDPDGVATLFDAADQTYGGIDVVINTAGIMILKPLAELDIESIDAMLRTNVRGTLLITQQAARRVRAGGAIVNFSSSVVKLAPPTYAAYAATKAASEAITSIVAKELRGKDITVNTVAPGPTATPLFLNGKSEAEVQQMAKAAPLERLGEPADIVEIIAFLAGPGRWVNGQTIYVNGGIV